LSTHQCARPDSASDTEPWRCLDCGMLWEPLPPEPATQSKPKRDINWPATVAVACLIAWGGVSYWMATLLPPMVVTIGWVALVVTAVAVAFWQNAPIVRRCLPVTPVLHT
jgi:hypothetical protein